MRLAEHVAKTVHVDAMLDGMTNRQFDEWCAKDIIEPIGHSGTHDILARLGVLIASFMGLKDPKEKMFKTWAKGGKPDDDGGSFTALEAGGWKRA